MLRIAPSVDISVLLRFQPLHDSAISIFDRRGWSVFGPGEDGGGNMASELELGGVFADIYLTLLFIFDWKYGIDSHTH